MASCEMEKRELKHLGFVRIAAIQALVCVSNLYDCAKQNSGPLRSTVGAVEDAVTAVISPVYDKFKGVPDHLLVFVDKKVDEVSDKFDKHAPPVAKEVVGQAQCLVLKASKTAQTIVSEAKAGGPSAALQHAATEYKHFMLTQLVKLWFILNKVPLFHTVADLAVPTAAHWSDKYNHVVTDMSGKGYTIFGYFPLVPIDKIAKTFKQGEAGKEMDSAASSAGESSSDSD
ncbi:hypothetical protein PVL29_001363 [Vitis rotundifolia]|uniref:REF/SRPP-like protein n=1 Tax=Vitis rotundifolia TaxID=103349 RepID=A0AA39AMZ9_VITRO|nr:hypothetical protein PVL29_001363 [Vitis rotundifolia]